MNTITFKCETITPMFMAGADGRTPELRAPSIKGVLRFWWRAINGHLNIEDLRKQEAAIFGGSGKEQGRSKVIIQLKNAPIYSDKYKYSPVPHKNEFIQKAFKPGNTFLVQLSMMENNIKFSNGESFNIETLRNLFIATSLLGGFGKRSRRGFGSIKIIKINDNDFISPEDVKEINNVLNNILPGKYVINPSSNTIVPNFKPNENYPCIKSIEMNNINSLDTFNDILKKIGNASSDFCDKSLGFAINNERQSSPIYVSVIKTSNKKYIPIVTTLNSAFKDPSIINSEKQRRFKEAIL